MKTAKDVARAALDYIDALPPEVVASLPAMPGFDRDWAENVLAAGVPAEVMEHVVEVDRRYTLDMSGVDCQQGIIAVENAINALRFLSENDRPIYGNSQYNTEHLYDIAHQLRRTLNVMRNNE